MLSVTSCILLQGLRPLHMSENTNESQCFWEMLSSCQLFTWWDTIQRRSEANKTCSRPYLKPRSLQFYPCSSCCGRSHCVRHQMTEKTKFLLLAFAIYIESQEQNRSMGSTNKNGDDTIPLMRNLVIIFVDKGQKLVQSSQSSGRLLMPYAEERGGRLPNTFSFSTP